MTRRMALGGLSALLLALSSCIEEYTANYEGEVDPVLIVTGQIYSDSTCMFVLQEVAKVRAVATNDLQLHQGYTKLEVRGENGDCWEGINDLFNPMHYSVTVGTLDPHVRYYLYIEKAVGGAMEVFESTPMLPLNAPDIAAIEYEVKGGTDLAVMVTTSELNEETYLSWDYEECWEIYTPMQTDWSFDPDKDEFLVKSLPSHGWSQENKHPLILASNLNYGNGTIRKLKIYDFPLNDNRIQTRYRTKVKQTAISREEYLYQNALITQSEKMGGLFTPMPSELPTNIKGSRGTRTVGYVGVRGRIAEAAVYIKGGTGIGYTPQRTVMPDDFNYEDDPGSRSLYFRAGYRPYGYNPLRDEARWVRNWCVNCEASYWNASPTRPDFWIDE